MSSRANSDQHLFDAMIQLKRHLRSCGKCSVARKAADPYLMCRAGLSLTLRAADRYDLLISLRVKAHASKQGTVFACPDPSAHGSPYALTARPFFVTRLQAGILHTPPCPPFLPS